MAKVHRIVKEEDLIVPIEKVLAETPWSKFDQILIVGLRSDGKIYSASSHPGANGLAERFISQYNSDLFDD